MGTEVLRPQDLLIGRFRDSPPSFHRRRNFPTDGKLSNVVVYRRPSNNAGYKRTPPKPDKKKSNETKKVANSGEGRRKDDRSGPAMGQVTLLRRGESLDSLTSKLNHGSPKSKQQERTPADDVAVMGTGGIGPSSPEMIPKQIRLSSPPRHDVYAGSAFFQSPSPRSLPLPSFFNIKQHDDIKISGFDDPATRDLRRLLRLD